MEDSEGWKRNLVLVFIAEFTAIMGFSFVEPFIPLFIQDLGSYTNREAAFWASIAAGGSSIAMFISAPLWGIVADRVGRKPMLLRAMFGGALVMSLMGVVPNVYFIIGLRFAQGLLTGTVPAASALMAATVPRNKVPFAIGLIMVAMFGGNSLGPVIGGRVADAIGYKTAFFITGSLLFLGAIIVLLFVRERFQRPARDQGASPGRLWQLARSREILPLLVVLAALSVGPSMVGPIIPLLVREVDSTGKVATASGLAFSLLSLVGALSSLVASRVAGRMSLKKMLFVSCVATGILYMLPMLADRVVLVLVFIALMGLFRGGISTSSNALVGLSVPSSQQGVAFGIAQSASSLGSGLAPFASGSLAPIVGLKPIFGMAGGLYILIGFLSVKVLAERPVTKTEPVV